MRKHRMFWLVWLVAIATQIAGCATAPHSADVGAKNDATLEAQFQQAEQQRAGRTEGQIIFAGFAMNSTSKAFRSDIFTAEAFVKRVDPKAIVFKLDNPALGDAPIWPLATPENLVSTLAKVSALARPQDKVIILMTTHGQVNSLSLNLSNQLHLSLNSDVMQRLLYGLRNKPTLLILSACYSGSFIEPLASPNRIILTAAAKDRSSFGCNFDSKNTFFVKALLGQPTTAQDNLGEMMSRAKVEVDRLEKAMRLSPPSLPQSSVGKQVESWANQPLKNWLTSP